MFKFFFFSIFAFFFIACSTHQEDNLYFQKSLLFGQCKQEFFEDEMKKVDNNDDTIYRGINSGSIARACKDYKLSNEFFDKAEQAYKYDVDLQSFGTKSAKFAATTLLNEGVGDYEGSLYERTMVNVYKGLNFMSLNDFTNARIEFNRALMRQDKAKEYFQSEIERQKEQNQKNDKNYEKNIEANVENVSKQYDNLFSEFNAQKEYTNPYITYISSVFFFMDKDYKKAADLLKEVYVLYENNEELSKEFKLFDTYSSSLNPQKLQKHIFIIYESGLSPALDEFTLTLPFIFDDGLVSASVALPTLKKREASYTYLSVSGGENFFQTQNLFDFDSVVASEFKATLFSRISKALVSTALKTSLNVAVAKNDNTGLLSLATNIFTIATTRSDLRFWNFLPKNAQVLMLENKGFIELKTDLGLELYQSNLNKNKDILIYVRSFTPKLEAEIYKIEN